MTTMNQDFEMYSGETKNIIITVTDATELSNVVVSWTVSQSEYSITNIFKKEGASVTVLLNKITIKVDPVDTVALTGKYFHKCKIVDQLGNVSFVTTGEITIYK